MRGEHSGPSWQSYFVHTFCGLFLPILLLTGDKICTKEVSQDYMRGSFQEMNISWKRIPSAV